MKQHFEKYSKNTTEEWELMIAKLKIEQDAKVNELKIALEDMEK